METWKSVSKSENYKSFHGFSTSPFPLFKGDLFFTWSIKGEVCYFKFYKEGLYIRGKTILKVDNLMGKLSYIHDQLLIVDMVYFHREAKSVCHLQCKND